MLINWSDSDGVLHFMNYGYHSDTEKIDLREEDESERFSIQLYHHIASCVNLQGLDLLEIGCGRGGGLSYIERHFRPGSKTGIDLNPEAIRFCRANNPTGSVAFEVMDSQKLEFPDESFDVVINVESSHRYPDFLQFAREVYRVLKPGGYCLFADFRFARMFDALLKDIRLAKFRVVSSEVINRQILSSLRMDSQRRIRLIENYLPRILRWIAREFAGTPGTRLYRSFERNARTYVFLTLAK